mmetsp:Transcript_16380/g.29579  ORF Transcript_16380/g.29579 Transcript_16380/m.29579 type:complete len:682 (+) Transcript_16380:160-2205(+)|eukprot:CAMPEP_0196142726 /NCGR_PEP_ID=MMETSP0910-20130528/12177_1 /TAXON_ID=49265 /ORGANISM="Thalassiosira rotula, Strain GSO102" /LENGTH=681 /DNA_ID=CAMNT_0041404083 /DNA_START=130 /DNA_END=2175 /DNA_ORIENTATION=+
MNLSTFGLCLLVCGLDVAQAFSTNVRVVVNPATHQHQACKRVTNQPGRRHNLLSTPPSPTQSSHRYAKSKNDDEEEITNPDDDNDEEGEDWRAFRAKLVMSESPSSSSSSSSSSPQSITAGIDNSDNNIIADDSDLDGIGSLFSDDSLSTTESGFTPLDPSQWAYDSGKVIETGAVILGGVEQDFGFGLRQQYFHKAVILVLDHDANTFTKGIILNRPSDRMMDDDVNEGLKWRVWYGGDVQGLDSLLPDIVCLHSLRGKEARECSVTVMKDIQWTSFENAKKLVKKGFASGPEDFWLFAGYAGWGPSQLSGELDRKSWYMCATDSRTLLKELARQSKGIDPRDAGLPTWELLMSMIGRGDTADECSGSFDDLMLKEWSQANLVKFDYREAGLAKNPSFGGVDISAGTIDKVMEAAARASLSSDDDVKAGSILRGSAADRSPFLLKKQELHHSLVLVVLEDDKVTLGCMLNHPATKGYEVGDSKKGTSSIIPVRYGGDYAIKGQSPLMWIHCNQQLRDSGLGEPFGDQSKGIYKCSQEEATEAISYNIAKPEDFLIMSGVCVWPKIGSNLANEVKRGVFEVVEQSKVEEVFRTLQKQEMLTEENLTENLAVTNEAWQKAASSKSSPDEKEPDETLTLGIGEGFDEDDDTVVFNSDKKVSQLANDALKKWVATFLLGSPTLA